MLYFHHEICQTYLFITIGGARWTDDNGQLFARPVVEGAETKR